MRLIDADALESKGVPFETFGGATFIALGSVRTAPTIDAVPVVRCRDCKHMQLTEVKNRYCRAWGRIQTMGDDGFCNFGERKDLEGSLMKSELCEGCAFWDEPMTEQPCCGCIDGCNADYTKMDGDMRD